MTSVRNILAVYAQATQAEREAGALWYPRANAVCGHLALAHARSLAEVCGLVAILSPRNRWERSLVDASNMLSGSGSVCTFGAQRTKAERLLSAGAAFNLFPVEVLRHVGQGPKTRSFFWNLLDPNGNEHVTIDGHAANIASGRRRPLAQVAITKHQYSSLSRDYRKAAGLSNVAPTTMQATTWVVWRRLHGIG